MMAEDANGDIENPKLPPKTSPPSSDVAVTCRKWKWIGLGTFLLVSVVLSIVLGVTLRGDASDASTSQNDALDDAGLASPVELGNGTNTTQVAPPDDGIGGNAGGASTSQNDALDDAVEGNDTNTTQVAQPDDGITPPVYTRQYLNSRGPIQSKLRIIDPSVADGYESCDDLRDDVLNAVKWLANSIIVQESAYSTWYGDCDPNATPSPTSVGSSGLTPTVGTIKEEGAATTTQANEDSFETNNQVEGVDEADVVKSDGDFVYAAYGDLLYVWNATDGTKGVSITAMPYEAINLTECYKNNGMNGMPEPMPMMTEEFISSETGEVDLQARSDGKRQRHNRNRKASSMMWDPCYQPKPRIDSLLLQGTRLTAIVSEDKFWYYGMKEESKPKIISDSTKVTIRVYDISDVPTDRSPLTLLGEKVVNGYYNSARSVDNTAIVMMTSYVDTSQITNDIYRWNPQYCGLNNTEYEELAVTTVLNKTGSFGLFVDQMMEELKFHNGGTCDSIFQIASMQSGDTQDSAVSDVIGTFVQLLSFDMSSDFNNDETTSTEVAEIFANVGGAFSSGWISSVYASQDFAATLSVGSKWNSNTSMWDQSTFILGFDISGHVPLPFSYAEISGQPLNQYSVDLYQGHLRVVTSEWFWSETTSSTSNKIFVLKVPKADGSEGPEMLLTGKTDHVGKPNEQVMSVRFMEAKAYIVTFERTDPFYVFNLTDPSKPQKIGELEIPGFSSYLHPIEIDGVPLMLGIGSHVNETTGWETGLKISLFNVSDPMNLKEIAVLVDEGAYSSGSWDFKSFRYLPLSQKLILPKTEYTWTDAGNFDGFVVYDITLDKIAPSYNIQHASSYDMHYGCWYSAYMPARSLVFQSKLTTILSHSVMSTDLDTGKKLWNLTLQGLENTVCSPYFY